MMHEREDISITQTWGSPAFGGRLQPALTAVLVVAVLGLFGWNAWLQSRLSDNNSALNSVVSEWRGSATVVTLVAKPGVTGVSGRLVMSGDRQEGGLIVGGMPALLQTSSEMTTVQFNVLVMS